MHARGNAKWTESVVPVALPAMGFGVSCPLESHFFDGNYGVLRNADVAGTSVSPADSTTSSPRGRKGSAGKKGGGASLHHPILLKSY
jgi:hypothetical protein